MPLNKETKNQIDKFLIKRKGAKDIKHFNKTNSENIKISDMSNMVISNANESGP